VPTIQDRDRICGGHGAKGAFCPPFILGFSNRLRHPSKKPADQAGTAFDLLRRRGLVVGDTALIKIFQEFYIVRFGDREILVAGV
jgi:hypothetical protein